MNSTNDLHDQLSVLTCRIDMLEAHPHSTTSHAGEDQRANGHGGDKQTQGPTSRTTRVLGMPLDQGERANGPSTAQFAFHEDTTDRGESSHMGGRFGHGKMPRTDFPRFDGEDPKWWKECCEKYFQMFLVPHANWSNYATLHFHGLAKSWLQSHEALHRLDTWSDLVLAVFAKFDKNKYEQQLEKLLKLKQFSTVQDYHVQFQELMHKVLVHNPGYDETFLVNRV